MSLTFRIGMVVVGVLLLAFISVGYLFERQMDEALDLNAQSDLRLLAERAGDELQRRVERLRVDALFLARSPPLQAIRESTVDHAGGLRDLPDAAAHFAAVQQVLLAVAYARPSYPQLRLISIDNGGQELVRIERDDHSVSVVPGGELQAKGDRYYIREARALREGEVYYSRIDLNREHGQVSLPERTMLRAATPVADARGRNVALMVINLDMAEVFGAMTSQLPPSMQMYVVNQDGFFLFHPDAARAMTFDRAQPYRLADEFGALGQEIEGSALAGGRHFDLGNGANSRILYATRRTFPLGGVSSNLTLIVTESAVALTRRVNEIHRDMHIAIGVLVGLGLALGMLLVHNMTRPLRVLVKAVEGVTAGDYAVTLPETRGRSDVARLAAAFGHMTEALQDRERRLVDLNADLERQVAERTGDLASSRAELLAERALQQSVLDNIGDGVIAVDTGGRFILWNERANQILGADAADVPAVEWPEHYGLYRSSDGPMLEPGELPLLQALRGETVRDRELFVRSAGNGDGRWISVFARPLTRPDGRIDGAVAVLTDVSERRHTDTQIEARTRELERLGRLTLIGQIIDTTAHRLSQPLAAIANYAGAAIQLRALGRLDDQRLDEILSHISRLAERGGEGLNNLRMLAPHADSSACPVNLNDTVEMALRLVKDRVSQQDVEVEKHLTADLPPVHGQQELLNQALVHLMINAIDSLAELRGTKRRLVVATACSADRRKVSVRIGDNGPGVPAHLQQTIFEPWHTTKPDALGIGLSVVRSIGESHNADVTLEEKDGLTWFSINLLAETST